jgi:hypothetical protein
MKPHINQLEEFWKEKLEVILVKFIKLFEEFNV